MAGDVEGAIFYDIKSARVMQERLDSSPGLITQWVDELNRLEGI
jgi:hypothetical protein